MFYWYKQALGMEPRLISSYYKYKHNSTLHNEFQKDARIAVQTGKGKTTLTITDLHTSDSASYYCAGSDMLNLEFFEGATIIVRGSGINIPASVLQSPSMTIQPQQEEELTLNCTVDTGSCAGEHSVYWFRDSEESGPGLIYAQGGKRDQCNRKNNTQTPKCVFSLPMKSLNLSVAETFYCAVVACGHVLFGNGTQINIQGKFPISMLYLSILKHFRLFILIFVLSLSLVTSEYLSVFLLLLCSEPTESSLLFVLLTCFLAFSLILAALLACALYTMSKRTSCQCEGMFALTTSYSEYAMLEENFGAILKQ